MAIDSQQKCPGLWSWEGYRSQGFPLGAHIAGVRVSEESACVCVGGGGCVCLFILSNTGVRRLLL